MFHESNRKRHYEMGGAPTLKLGLIGDNIAASRAPDLHRIAGRLNNIDVQYDRLIPKEMNQTFDQIFKSCPDNGYQALNITYPYKRIRNSKGRNKRSNGARNCGGQHCRF